MQRPSWAGRLNQKSILYIVFAGLIIGTTLSLYARHRAKQPISTNINTAIIQSDSSDAQKAIDNKDYKSAINSYIEAVNTAEAANDNEQAEVLLKEAVSQIPTKDVPWLMWDDLVGAARTQGDKKEETIALKQAIIAAQTSNSGAPTGIVKTYQDSLKQLGASE